MHRRWPLITLSLSLSVLRILPCSLEAQARACPLTTVNVRGAADRDVQ
jgi:hypothetical protein